MTGLGTKESPFKIQTVEDFLSMGTTGNPTAYYELANDINMDGDGNRRLQENPKITLNCVSLDGNGHKIRNLILMHPTENVRLFAPAEGVENVTITNLGFENLNFTGATVSIFSGDECTYRLYKCSFSIFVKTDVNPKNSTNIGLINYSESAKMMCDSCTFIVRHSYTNAPAVFISGTGSSNAYVRNCQFKFDGTLKDSSASSTSTGSFFKNIEITNVFFEGHVRALNRTPDTDSYFSLTEVNCRISNMLVMLGGTNVNKIAMGGKFFSSCVYNLDTAGDAEYVTSSSSQALSPELYGFTDEECRSAERLKEIGFEFEEA